MSYSPKFNQFDISEIPYKTVNDQPISAFIMLPKNTPPGKHPVIAKFHGGGFTTGASLYAPWFSQWALDYCVHNSAMFVSADYRLLPESSGLDILDDVSDFWGWVKGGKFEREVGVLREGVVPDLEKVLVYGESAGGSLALQSGFSEPDIVKAVIATYPIVNRELKRTESIMGFDTVPPEVLEDYLKAMVPGKIVSSATPPERLRIWLSMAQQDRLGDFFGRDERLSPIKVLAKTERAPFMLIMHGSDDTIVPIQGSYEFEELAKNKFGPGKMELVVQPGEHGFDAEIPIEAPWLKNALEKVTKVWLS